MRKEVSLIRYAIFVFHIVYTNKDKDLFFFPLKRTWEKKKKKNISVQSCSYSQLGAQLQFFRADLNIYLMQAIWRGKSPRLRLGSGLHGLPPQTTRGKRITTNLPPAPLSINVAA